MLYFKTDFKFVSVTTPNRLLSLFILWVGILLPSLVNAAPKERKVLVIPVEFKDVAFTYTSNELEAFLNADNFSFEGATGSVSEYFNDQVGASFKLDFHLAPIVSLPEKRAYYGANNSLGLDNRPDEMVREACISLDEALDFSIFDNDSTGRVQHLIMIYAGGDEALGAPAECLWSQCWSLEDLGKTLNLDDTTIDVFACTSELGDDGKLSGIGRFCHETLHTFGFPDFYDSYIPAEKAYYSAALWSFTSLMDGGWKNNGGHTPPSLNAVERYLLGIEAETQLSPGTVHLSPIGEKGAYAKLDCPEEGEFFLFECRSKSGWDRFIGGEGLLVYHIDRTNRTVGEYRGVDCSAEKLWDYNLANIFPAHQCIDLVEASGKNDRILRNRQIREDEIPDIFFPAGGQSLGPYTEPALRSWYSGSLGLSINRISNGISGGIDIAIGTESIEIEEPEIYQDAVILHWTCRENRRCSIKLDSTVVSPLVLPLQDSTYSYLIEGLEPGTRHTVTITDSNGFSRKQTFTTRSFSAHSRPRILTDNFPKDRQGYIKAGSRIPLRLENAPGEKVYWYADEEILIPGSDGKIPVEKSFVLKARIYRGKTSAITIVKELKVL